MVAHTFDEQLASGRVGESLIARYLKSKGLHVLPVYELEVHTGKGPRLFSPDRQLIAPDMLAFKMQGKNGRAWWIEAKHKTGFTLYRKTGEWLTGIDIKHYEDYCQLADATPWDVWLFFLHKGGQAKDSPPSPAGLFINRLSVLRECEHHRWQHMVYWAKESLIERASFDEILSIENSYVGSVTNGNGNNGHH